MRFCGLSIADPVPDANTLWDFREALIRSGALDQLFARLDQAIKTAGYLPMSGQIVDASLVAAPRQRNTEEEKAAIKAGKKAREIWPDEPAKAAQKDTDARWTVKTSKGKVEADGTIKRDLAIPAFGYKSHIGIDRRHGFIRRQKVTDAAAHDGARLREGLIDPSNTASDVPLLPPGSIPFGSRIDRLLTIDGPTRPTARKPTRSSWPIAARPAAFTAGSPPANRCRSTRPEPTPGNPRSAPASSTSSRSRRRG